jgi:nucleotide-binding universal stress UspA family protein
VLSIKRILVATDFTDASDRALDYALELARKLDASIVLMHSYEIPVVGFPDGVLIATPNVAGQLRTAAQEGLRATVARHAAAGVRVDTVLREGAATREVNALAEELDADLIVLGTHGRKGIAHAILGSVAEQIVRTARRPVLTIHDAPAQKADAARGLSTS